MKEVIEKIEFFLFDIVGILIPGMLFILLLLMPILFFNQNTIDLNPAEATIDLYDYKLHLKSNFSFINEIKENNGIINLLNVNKAKILIEMTKHKQFLTIIFFIVSYLIGTTIKVFSKMLYDMLKIIFDYGIIQFLTIIHKIIFKFLNHLKEICFFIFKKKIENKTIGEIKKIYLNNQISFFEELSKFIKKNILSLLIFSVKDYGRGNEKIEKKTRELLKERFEMEFPDNWYSVYKISTVIIAEENLKSLSYKFLTKYNFYRSLAFVFFINFLYLITIKNLYSEFFNYIFIRNYILILIINTIFFITFHVKYKRYWILCGTESLMNLFYFLTKQRGVGKNAK